MQIYAYLCICASKVTRAKVIHLLFKIVAWDVTEWAYQIYPNVFVKCNWFFRHKKMNAKWKKQSQIILRKRYCDCGCNDGWTREKMSFITLLFILLLSNSTEPIKAIKSTGIKRNINNLRHLWISQIFCSKIFIQTNTTANFRHGFSVFSM